MTHLYPMDDVREHDLTGTECPCGAVLQLPECVILHRSWDGRELLAEAKDIIAAVHEHKLYNGKVRSLKL